MEWNGPHTDPWLVARNRYMEDLSEEEKKLFKSASIENLFYTASAAEKNHAETSMLRAISKKLEPFVAAVDQYGKALDIYSNTYGLAMGPLWGSLRVLLHIAMAFEDYFHKLTDMLIRIGDVLPRCRIYHHLFPTHERLLQAISVTYLDIILFCMKAKATFRKLKKSTAVHFGLKLIWKNFKKDFDQTLNEFRDHVKRVEKEAGLSNLIEDANARALARADRAEREIQRKIEKRNSLLSQLSSIKYANKHLKERQKRHPGTATWIAEAQEFKNWMNGVGSGCLWCSGIPGSGKTILASNVIDMLSSNTARKDITINHLTSEEIIRKTIARQETAVVYHYCDFSDSLSLETRNILGAIIRQLLENITIPADLEHELEMLYRPGTRMAAENELFRILMAVVNQFSRVFLCIDGLDECEMDEQAMILPMVNQLAQCDDPTLKVLITSREEGDISTALQNVPRLRITAESNSSEIAGFIEYTVKSKIQSKALAIEEPSLESDIITALTQGADGMFLWVRFQMADLCDAASDFAIRETLRSLPKGMAETYARVLGKIRESETHTALAQRAFKWIVCARRPLLISELAEAVAFGPTDRSWDARKIPNSSRLMQACRSLVVFDEDDRTVRLAHHTVQQYLLDPAAGSLRSEFHFGTAQANTMAGETCIAYLMFSDFERQIIPVHQTRLRSRDIPGPTRIADTAIAAVGPQHAASSVHKLRQYLHPGNANRQTPDFNLAQYAQLKKPAPSDLRRKYQFLNYVIENWVSHTSDFSEESTSMWKSFQYLALEKPMAFDIRPWGKDVVGHRLPFTALFRWAVDAGHVPLLKLLSELPADSDLLAYCQQESEGSKSVVLHASRRGHPDVIEYLAQQNCIDDEDGSLLVSLVENEHNFAVAMLLEYKLCLSSKGEAIVLAAHRGQDFSLELLLRSENHIQVQTKWFKAALVAAAKNEFDRTLVLLLSKADSPGDAAQCLQEAWGYRPLRAAADKGLRGVARLLAMNGSLVNEVAGNDFPPLHKAIERHDVVLAEALIENGVNLRATDDQEQTAMHVAVNEGYQWVTQLLIAKGADLKSKNSEGQTVLHVAAQNGDVGMVDLLVENGAYLEEQDNMGWTALDTAFENRRWLVVGILAQKGADVKSKDSEGRTVLHIAAQEGNIDLMQLMVETGISLEEKDDAGRTALYMASDLGNLAVVEFLAGEGANVDAADIAGQTPLHAAVDNGHQLMVLLLIAKGADVNRADAKGWTALHFAAWRGDEAILNLLVSAGALVNARTTASRTAFWLARRNGHERAMRVLMDIGDGLSTE